MSEIPILAVVGTRPEAIKMAPVIRELRRPGSPFRTVVCASGQHRELLDATLAEFAIEPDVRLAVMTPDQGLAPLLARLIEGLDPVFGRFAPAAALAQGDTATALAAALVAYFRGVPFGHVEAGLRTGDLARPFPEEFHRRAADLVASWRFAPTDRAAQNLRAEGCDPASILLTGNTVVDALRWIDRREESADPAADPWPADRPIVLVTVHRRESFGPTLLGICRAIRALADRSGPSGPVFVLPVHPNPNVGPVVREALGDHPSIVLTEPLDYRRLVRLLRRAILVLTDSGGLQEEAPSFGVPVLILRETTERPEGVEAGVARLLGTDPARIVAGAGPLLADPEARSALRKAGNPYGDGRAAARIVERLTHDLVRTSGFDEPITTS